MRNGLTSTAELAHLLLLELEDAACDPLFLADIQEIEEAFRSADKQTTLILDND